MNTPEILELVTMAHIFVNVALNEDGAYLLMSAFLSHLRSQRKALQEWVGKVMQLFLYVQYIYLDFFVNIFSMIIVRKIFVISQARRA